MNTILRVFDAITERNQHLKSMSKRSAHMHRTDRFDRQLSLNYKG